MKNTLKYFYQHCKRTFTDLQNGSGGFVVNDGAKSSKETEWSGLSVLSMAQRF